jgi:SsrA-binding protein
MKLIANNKKAYYDYFIEEKFEAGLCLEGSEVKSIRNGNCSIKESYIKINNSEAYIIGMYIKNYEQKNTFNKLNETRERKLLLNKSEIRKLENILKDDGYTIMPLQVYLNEKGKVKLEIGSAKGKKNYDKREVLKKKTQSKEIAKYMKNKIR